MCQQDSRDLPKTINLNLTVGESLPNTAYSKKQYQSTVLYCLFGFLIQGFSLSSGQSTAFFAQNTPIRQINLTGWLYTRTPNSLAGCQGKGFKS